MIKTLIILGVLGYGGWYLMSRAKENATVQQMQKAPEQYVKSLQNGVTRVQDTVNAANKVINQKSEDVEKALDAAAQQ